MIEHGPAKECAVILAFLQAEVQSPRFAPYVHEVLRLNGLSQAELITCADLENPRDNLQRYAILQAYRGYGKSDALFARFPSNVAWRSVEIEPSDHVRLKFANYRTWVEVSDGTRSVQRLAEKLARHEVPADPAEHVLGIQNALKAGAKLAPLLIVEGNESSLVIVEGHCRATAYVGLEWNEGIPAFLGTSPQMRSWAFF